MYKIVINECFGGFGLSDEALAWMKNRYREVVDDYRWRDEEMRDDHRLVAVVEELGAKANGDYAQLRVVEIPDHVKGWHITDYDGVETVREDHWKS